MKTKVRLTGTDGNVFALIGRCTSAMKKAKVDSSVIKEMTNKIFGSGSYSEALGIMSDYCEVS